MEANSVMGKHEFVITVSNILPEFKSLPDWQKEAAYSQFSRDIEETTWDNDHLDPAELGQVMFSSGQLDKYLRVAVKAGGIMELLKTYADRLGDYQNLSQLIRSELQMFEKINPNVGVNGEMQYQYSLDLSGQYPILDAVFDADYNTAALSIYDNPIDLKTGQVLPKVQATQREESSAPEKEAQPKNKYEISCRPVSFPDSNIRAFVDVTVNDAVQIHGIRIIEGRIVCVIAVQTAQKCGRKDRIQGYCISTYCGGQGNAAFSDFGYLLSGRWFDISDSWPYTGSVGRADTNNTVYG